MLILLGYTNYKRPSLQPTPGLAGPVFVGKGAFGAYFCVFQDQKCEEPLQRGLKVFGNLQATEETFLRQKLEFNLV